MESRAKKITKIQGLLKLVAKLPAGLRADWDGTNHYELTQGEDKEADYWWLDLSDFFDWEAIKVAYPCLTFCKTELGQRIGLLLDIAEKAKEAEEELKGAI